MKITSLDRTVADLLKEYLFIPRFQRPYSWEKEQVEQFWEDTIRETGASDYFIGSIVLYKHRDEFGIVDGQQRITTILLTLAALRKAFDEHELGTLAEGIQALIERPDRDAEKRFVLRTESSFPFLQDRFLRHGSPELEHEPTAEERLIEEMSAYLRQQIDDAVAKWPRQSTKGTKTEGILRTIRDRLLALKLITVEMDNEDDAYLVFETLNTRGKDLQVSHLVKNHFSRLTRASNRGLDPLKLKWAKLLKTFETTQAELDVDSYIHHFWLSRSKEYVTAKKLFASFKKAVTPTNVKGHLDALLKDATLYRQVGEPSYGKWKREDKALRASLSAISSVFRMRQPYPLLLSLLRCYRDGTLSKKNVEATLWIIECFHFKFTAVAQKSSSGGISFMYASWAQKLSNAKSADTRQSVLAEIKRSLKERIPSAEDFAAGFAELRYSDEFTRQKRLVKYILSRVEDHLSHSGVAVDFDDMTIEHVAPQNPGPGAAAVGREHVAMMGNLLLCDTGLQDELGNKSFTEKRGILRRSRVGAARSVTKHPSWTTAEIESRTAELAGLAYKDIWKF